MMQTKHCSEENTQTDFGEDQTGANEATFSEKMNRLEDVVTRHPLNREILYSILAYCRTERSLSEIEEYVSTLPQFKAATQNQYRMVEMLENAYGLEVIEYDEHGDPVDLSAKPDLSEDEIDDLVTSYAYVTTEVGACFVEQHRPQARIIELLNLVPERADTYKEILAFIGDSPRTYDEVCQFLKGCPALETIIDGQRNTMQPSVFLDKLERSGALVWNGKWNLTKEGGESLAELKDS